MGLRKRCGCINPETGKQWASKCPKLKRDGGGWSATHGTWLFSTQVFVPGKGNVQYQRGGFSTRADAIAAQDDVKARQRIGTDVTRDQLKVSEYLDGWLDMKADELSKNTVNSYRGYARRVWRPYLGHMKLTDVRAPHVVHALKATTKDGSTSRMRAKAMLSSAFEDAVRESLVSANPAKRVKVKITSSKRATIWTEAREAEWRRSEDRPSSVMVWRADHLTTFLDDQHGDPMFAAWWLMSYRGMRRGEALALRWSSVDLTAGTVTVDKQRVKTTGSGVYEQPPKSASGKRTVPLGVEGAEVLREHRRQQLATVGRQEYVLVDPHGEPWDPQAVSHQFRKRVRALDLPPTRAHDLRHLCATLLLSARVPMRVVMEVLGHSQMRLTSDTYTSAMPDLLVESLDAMDTVIPRGRRHTTHA